MRKTKIICTLGPACSDEETIEAMCKAGMNVARLNFSHNTYEEHEKRIEIVKKVRKKLNLPIALLLDTKGPECRIRTFKDGKITLNEGDSFTFTTNDIIGDETKVSVNYKNLPKELKQNDTIFVNDGLVKFSVEEVSESEIRCKVIIGGTVSDRKSMSFPGKSLKQIYLSEQDKVDLLFGIKHDIDFVCCSFVSCKEDILSVKNFLCENSGKDIGIIAKIENRAGVDNIIEISEECDGILIGRGDMGVEIPFEELPAIQKKLITTCRLLGKRVITATEMLESMVKNPRPTRAEISDVANAVYDGTSAIMLSGETAAGAWPVEAVKTMAKIAEQTELAIHYKKRFLKNDFQIRNNLDAISHATCGMAMDIDAKAIVVCSLSGVTARMISRFRCPVNIIGLTVNEKTWRQLSLSWGVTPILDEVYPSVEVLFYNAKKIAKETIDLKSGDRIIITGGVTDGTSGNTNTIKIETI